MKSIIFTILLTTLFITISFSQGTWSQQNSGTNAILQSVFFVDQDYGWIAGAHIILHTTNGGNTWVEQPAPPVQIYYVDIFFLDRMNGWACGNEAKIIHTTDGGNTWIEQPNPYTFPNPILYSIFFANPDTGWALGGDHGNYPTFTPRRVVLYTTNGGNSWDFQYSVSNELPIYCSNFISPMEGFAASESGDVISTSNGGITWINKTPISSYRLFGIHFINPSVGWISGEYLGVPHVSSISKTTDGGTSWQTKTFGTDQYLQDIYFVDEMTGWAVGGTIGTSGTATILHTTDGGTNWNSQGVPTSNTLLGVDFSGANRGWAIGTDGTILSYQNSVPVELNSFTATAKNNDVTLNWETASEINNCSFEIYRSASFGNWSQIGIVEGHGTTTLENHYKYLDKNLEPGNYSYKIVQIDFDGSQSESDIVNVEVVNIVKEYVLNQNYPNPFNPSTTIKYSIPQSGDVKLILYNSLGEEVAILVNDLKGAGNYKVIFNAFDIPSGVYYYKLNAGSFEETKKMILLR